MIIARYLAREILQTLVAITLILLFIFSCNEFVRYLGYVANGKYAAWVLVNVVLLQVPILLGLLLPLGLYLGILLGYGRLYAESEMTVLFACGFSQKQLFKITLGFSVIVTLIVMLLSLWVQPVMSLRSREALANAESGSMLQTVLPGRFQSMGENRVFYVGKISRNHEHVGNVFVAERMKANSENQSQPWGVLFAKGGYEMTTKKGNRYIVMSNGHLYKGTPGEKDYEIVQYEKYGIRTAAKTEVNLTNHIEAIATSQLWVLASIKDKIHKKYIAELQWRFSAPLSVILLTIVALPLSRLKPRQGKFAKILPAVLLYIVYANLLFVGREWLAEGVTPVWLGLWWIHLSFLVLGLIIAKLSNQWGVLFKMIFNRRKVA